MNFVIYYFIALLLGGVIVTICLSVIILSFCFIVGIVNKLLKKLIPLIRKYPIRITTIFLILIIGLIYVKKMFLKNLFMHRMILIHLLRNCEFMQIPILMNGV